MRERLRHQRRADPALPRNTRRCVTALERQNTRGTISTAEQEMREIKFWFYLAHFDPDFSVGTGSPRRRLGVRSQR